MSPCQGLFPEGGVAEGGLVVVQDRLEGPEEDLALRHAPARTGS